MKKADVPAQAMENEARASKKRMGKIPHPFSFCELASASVATAIAAEQKKEDDPAAVVPAAKASEAAATAISTSIPTAEQKDDDQKAGRNSITAAVRNWIFTSASTVCCT